MNRNDEFLELKQELDQTPAQLEYIAAKAITRAKKQKRRSILWKTPAISFCSLVILFVLLVNLFPKVALAMSNVPFLKNLIQAVSFDPSLKAAVENDYYQTVGDSQTQGDVTATVESMIVDAEYISIFFSVDAPVKSGLFRYDILDSEGNTMSGISTQSTCMYNVGELQKIQIDFVDRNVRIPDKLLFKLTVNQNPNFQESLYAPRETVSTEPADDESIGIDFTAGPNYDFTFTLNPDEVYAKTVNQYPINQWLEINNQRIYLDSINIYPTSAKLFLDYDDNNSAVIQNLDVYYKDNDDNIYGLNKSGICMSSGDAFDVSAIYSESSYFSKSDHLSMYIYGISMLDKVRLYSEISYQDKVITNIPEGITLTRMELKNSDLYIDFKFKYDISSNILQIFGLDYYDLDGKQYYFFPMCVSPDVEGNTTVHLKIPNYEDNKYRLRWNYPTTQVLDEPIEIKIK